MLHQVQRSREQRYKAFYDCIQEIFDDFITGKWDVNKGIQGYVSKYRIGNIKKQPYIDLMKLGHRPTWEECCQKRDELSRYQSLQNKNARLKRKLEQKNVNSNELKFQFDADSQTLLQLLEQHNGEDVAAIFLFKRGWKLKRPITEYEDFEIKA